MITFMYLAAGVVISVEFYEIENYVIQLVRYRFEVARKLAPNLYL